MARYGIDDSGTSIFLPEMTEVSAGLFCGDFTEEFDDDDNEDDRKDRDDK